MDKMSKKKLAQCIWELNRIAGMLRCADKEFPNLPFEYKPVLNATGKILERISRLLLMLKNKEKYDKELGAELITMYRKCLDG